MILLRLVMAGVWVPVWGLVCRVLVCRWWVWWVAFWIGDLVFVLWVADSVWVGLTVCGFGGFLVT